MAEASLFVMDLNEERYAAEPQSMLSHINVGTGHDVSIGELAELLCEVTGFQGRIAFNPGANQTVEQVRRREAVGAKSLKRSPWIWSKNCGDLTAKQVQQFQSLPRENLETGRAWRLKEGLRTLYAEAPSRKQAEDELTRWVSWARRCRQELFKRLAATNKAHWDGILNVFDSRLTNGAVEGMNGLIQAAKARARGSRTAQSLITMSYLIGGKLSALPANPYTTRHYGQAA